VKVPLEMLPTKLDFEFWQSKQRVPGWAVPILAKPKPYMHVGPEPTIDAVINSHVPVPKGHQEKSKWRQQKEWARKAHNAMIVLRRYRGQQLVDMLHYCAEHVTNDPTGTAKERQFYARRWLRRLGKNIPIPRIDLDPLGTALRKAMGNEIGK
jgi:hypothetical protein